MDLLRLNNEMILSNKYTYDIYSIRSKISDYLIANQYRVDLNEEDITFKLIGSITAASGDPDARLRVLKILKEGKISLHKKPQFFTASWIVHLDSLYFIAFCVSILTGFFSWLFLHVKLMPTIIIVLAFFVLFVFLGIIFLKRKLNAIILKMTYYKH